jgi:hypothetical protein
MAHYSVLNADNVVTAVLTGIDETELIPWLNPETKLIEQLDPETFYSKQTGKICKRTSFNTKSNTHLNNKTPFRGNFGEPGFTYNEELDAFIPPKPFESAVLDVLTLSWNPPIDFFKSADTFTKTNPETRETHVWDDETLSWQKIPLPSDEEFKIRNAILTNDDIYRWNSATESWEKED